MPSKISAGSAFVTFGADLGPLSKALNKVNRSFRDLGRNISTVGAQAFKAGSVAASGFALAAVVGADYSDKILEAGLTTNATADEFDRLSDKAKELGRTTSFTAAQVASGLAEIGRTTGSVDTAVGSIQTVLDVARATNQELAESALLITTTANIFDTNDFQQVGDILVATANNSAQNIFDLTESLKFAGKEGAALGLTLSTTAKFLGVLAQGGLKASTAGTGLRQIFNSLAKSDVQDALKDLGVSVTDAAENLRDPVVLLKDIQNALKGFPPLVQKAKLTELFDVRGAAAALSVFAVTEDKIKSVNKAVDESQGTARNFAKVLDSRLGGAFRLLTSAIQSLAIEITEAAEKPLTKIIKQITKFSSGVAVFISQNPKFIRQIASLTAATITLGATLTAAGVALTVLGSLFTPFGAILLAVGVAVVALSDTIAESLGAEKLGLVDFIANWKIAGTSIGTYVELGVLKAQKEIFVLQNKFSEVWKFIVLSVKSFPTQVKVSFLVAAEFIEKTFVELNLKLTKLITGVLQQCINYLRIIKPLQATLLQNLVRTTNKAIEEREKNLANRKSPFAELIQKEIEELQNLPAFKDLTKTFKKNAELEKLFDDEIKNKEVTLQLRDDALKGSNELLAEKLQQLKDAINSVGVTGASEEIKTSPVLKLLENSLNAIPGIGTALWTTLQGAKAISANIDSPFKKEETSASAVEEAQKIASSVEGSFSGRGAFGVGQDLSSNQRKANAFLENIDKTLQNKFVARA